MTEFVQCDRCGTKVTINRGLRPRDWATPHFQIIHKNIDICPACQEAILKACNTKFDINVGV